MRAPIAIGKTFHADVETSESFLGADAYGPGVYPSPSIDTVIYDADYNFTGFVMGPYVPSHSTSSYYDPLATEPYENFLEASTSPTVDLFNGIDRVQFNNGMYFMGGRDDPAIAVEALYNYVGRETPDRGGFEFWLNGLDHGVSLGAVVDGFIAAKAEAAQQGLMDADPVSHLEFIEALYEDVLGYAGDEGGLAFWSGNLEAGLADRGDVLTEFVKVAGDVYNHGSWFDWS